MASEAKTFTTVSVTEEVRKRLESLKPFSSMSYSEFLSHMADHYEEEVASWR